MILVVGATGDLGGRVVRRFREQGRDLRCLVRPRTDDAELRRLGAQVVRGDLTDPKSLPAACEGIETVVASATAIGRRLAGARRPTIYQVDQVGMSDLVDAAEEAGVERFVYLSYAGIDAGIGTPIERAKVAIELRLQRSSMRSVIVRPDAFQEIHLGPLARFDMARGRVVVFGKGDMNKRWVSTDDVAAVVVAAALEPDPPRVIEFGGPEAISRNEAIAVAERLTGRKFKRQRIPAPVAKLAMRVLARPNDALASVFGTGLMLDLIQPRWDDTPLQQRGITARSASEFLEQQARAL